MSKKPRPCLRCDKPFVTTPEIRICAVCKGSTGSVHIAGKLRHYAGYQEALGGIGYNREFNKPVFTRGKNE